MPGKSGALILASFALLAGACSRQTAAANNMVAVASPAAPPRSAAPVIPIPPRSACAPAPSLVMSADFEDPRSLWGAQSERFRNLQSNWAAAYRRACDQGLFRPRPLIRQNEGPADRLFLVNAPEANIAAIYYDEGRDRRTILEYYFIAGDGRAYVPDSDDLFEAIYCHVHGASEQEQETSGRCLAD